MSEHNELSPRSWPLPRLLTLAEQQEYVSLMRLGAPPELACQRVDVSPDDVQATCDRDADFAERLELIEQHLARNVQSAIYKAAMKGSVYAQANYLRQCRPAKKSREIEVPLAGSLEGAPSMEEMRHMLLKEMSPPESANVAEGLGI